jgi:glycosyltransferase involved in cell wall biosynthesis
MKVLMILDEEFPPDSRVEKEALSLVGQGYKVTIACYTISERPSFEIYKGIAIRRMKISRFTYKLSAACLVIPYYFWRWQLFLNKLTKEIKPDIIHVHDLPLAKLGIKLKKKTHSKVVLDQHEYYSNWIIHTAHMNTLIGRIVKRLSNWEKYEKTYLRKADLVITVAEPLRLNYIGKYEINENQIITIPNTPSKEIYNLQYTKSDIIEKYADEFMIFYAGGIDILRGINTAIKALKKIEKEIPRVKLVLAGKIIKPYDPFKVAKQYHVDKLIEFVGWLNEEDLPSYITASKICFFTPPSTRDEINNTIATKIYQYAMMGKPIITSDAKLMRQFVESNKLGYSVKADDDIAFANAALKVYKNELRTNSFSDQQKNKISWEYTVLPMLKEYKSLIEVK